MSCRKCNLDYPVRERLTYGRVCENCWVMAFIFEVRHNRLGRRVPLSDDEAAVLKREERKSNKQQRLWWKRQSLPVPRHRDAI